MNKPTDPGLAGCPKADAMLRQVDPYGIAHGDVDPTGLSGVPGGGKTFGGKPLEALAVLATTVGAAVAVAVVLKKVGAKSNPRARKSGFSRDAIVALADKLSKKVGGSSPTYIQGGFRYSDANESAKFKTYSPEYSQKIVVVVSAFEDGTYGTDFFSDEDLSGTSTFESIGNFTYNGPNVASMAKDVKWVQKTVDEYAESWNEGGDDE